MLVILGERIPSRVRGVLELWMIEPKPCVFVGCLTKRVEDELIKFIQPFLDDGSGLAIFNSNEKSVQGFSIHMASIKTRVLSNRDNLYLIQKPLG